MHGARGQFVTKTPSQALGTGRSVSTLLTLESPDLSLATTGLKTFALTHGLGVKPDPTHVQVSVRQTSPTLSALWGSVHLAALDVNVLTVRLYVVQAGLATDTVRVVAWVLA